MEVTRLRTVLGVFAACLAASFLATELIANRWPSALSVPWTTAAAVAFAAAVVLVAAWPVRQYVRGKRRWIDPLRAAGTLAFAKACAWAGAALAGLWTGVVTRSILEWASPIFHERALTAGAAALASIALTAAGLTAEHWCRLPPPTDEENPAPA